LDSRKQVPDWNNGKDSIMASLLVNIFLAGWIVLFAAMALLPMLLERSKSHPRTQRNGEDRVLRIEHKAVVQRRSGVTEPVLVPMRPIEHPGHRPAA
jgi:hypothetical protein